MPHARCLLLPLATAAILFGTASPALAESRRSAQSMPAPARFVAPATSPLRAGSPARASRDEDRRAPLARNRTPDRDNFARGDRADRGGRDHHDNRRYDYDRDDYEHRKDHEGHHFGHHGHNDSPGC